MITTSSGVWNTIVWNPNSEKIYFKQEKEQKTEIATLDFKCNFCKYKSETYEEVKNHFRIQHKEIFDKLCCSFQ